jgi:hypothetical protein
MAAIVSGSEGRSGVAAAATSFRYCSNPPGHRVENSNLAIDLVGERVDVSRRNCRVRTRPCVDSLVADLQCQRSVDDEERVDVPLAQVRQGLDSPLRGVRDDFAFAPAGGRTVPGRL